MALLRDLDRGHHALVLDAAGYVQPRPVVPDGGLGSAIDENAGLGDAVGRDRRPALPRRDARHVARLGARPGPQRRQRHAVAGERLGLQPLQPTHRQGLCP